MHIIAILVSEMLNKFPSSILVDKSIAYTTKLYPLFSLNTKNIRITIFAQLSIVSFPNSIYPSHEISNA